MSQPICRHCAAGVQLFKRCRNLSASTVLQRCSCLSGVPTYMLGTVLHGCSCLSGVKTYLPALCCRVAAVLAVSQPICRHCVAGVQLFKQCQNLCAGTKLQGCSCPSGVKTYLLALCCRGAAVVVVSKPICRHCVAGVQLLKWCQSLSAGTVLQRCSCLNGVETYLPALCCKGVAV